jgi:hypothetical protein
LPVASSERALRIAHCGPPVTRCSLPATRYSLPTARCPLPARASVGYRLSLIAAERSEAMDLLQAPHLVDVLPAGPQARRHRQRAPNRGDAGNGTRLGGGTDQPPVTPSPAATGGVDHQIDLSLVDEPDRIPGPLSHLVDVSGGQSVVSEMGGGAHGG